MSLVHKARCEFVNRNAAADTSTTGSPELLAKHADALLRKSNKMGEEEGLEGALNKVVCGNPDLVRTHMRHVSF